MSYEHVGLSLELRPKTSETVSSAYTWGKTVPNGGDAAWELTSSNVSRWRLCWQQVWRRWPQDTRLSIWRLLPWLKGSITMNEWTFISGICYIFIIFTCMLSSISSLLVTQGHWHSLHTAADWCRKSVPVHRWTNHRRRCAQGARHWSRSREGRSICAKLVCIFYYFILFILYFAKRRNECGVVMTRRVFHPLYLCVQIICKNLGSEPAKHSVSHVTSPAYSFMMLLIRYDTIAEFNVDWKAEYSA